MDKDFNDTSLAESSITLQLARIQRRCNQLLADPDGLELALEEPSDCQDGTNPYNRG